MKQPAIVSAVILPPPLAASAIYGMSKSTSTSPKLDKVSINSILNAGAAAAAPADVPPSQAPLSLPAPLLSLPHAPPLALLPQRLPPITNSPGTTSSAAGAGAPVSAAPAVPPVVAPRLGAPLTATAAVPSMAMPPMYPQSQRQAPPFTAPLAPALPPQGAPLMAPGAALMASHGAAGGAPSAIGQMGAPGALPAHHMPQPPLVYYPMAAAPPQYPYPMAPGAPGAPGGDPHDYAAHEARRGRRYRRRYLEIVRLYLCLFPGCDKLYGSLNHLNTHIVTKKHGHRKLKADFQNKDERSGALAPVVSAADAAYSSGNYWYGARPGYVPEQAVLAAHAAAGQPAPPGYMFPGAYGQPAPAAHPFQRGAPIYYAPVGAPMVAPPAVANPGASGAPPVAPPPTLVPPPPHAPLATHLPAQPENARLAHATP